MRHTPPPHEFGYTGRVHEEDLLGAYRFTDDDLIRAKRTAIEIGVDLSGERMTRRQALELARRFQPWPDATKPRPVLLKTLRDKIVAALIQQHVLLPEDAPRVKIYTAIGRGFGMLDTTPADRFFGIDGFADLTDEHGRVTATVTFDVTENQRSNKPLEDWDHLLLDHIPDPGINPQEFEKYVTQAGAAIAQRLTAPPDRRRARVA